MPQTTHQVVIEQSEKNGIFIYGLVGTGDIRQSLTIPPDADLPVISGSFMKNRKHLHPATLHYVERLIMIRSISSPTKPYSYSPVSNEVLTIAKVMSLQNVSPRRLSPWKRHFALAFLAVFLFSACNDEEPGLVYESQINRWQSISERHGLSSNYVNTIFEDSKGNIWVGTDWGLSVLSGKEFVNYSVADGLLDNNVFAISEDKDGRIWAGTDRGINILVDDRWLYFGFFYGVPVYGLVNLKKDIGMLVGTGGFGVYRYNYDDEEFGLYSYVEGCNGCNSINSIFQAKDETVWIGSFAGARKIRGTFITQFDETDGLSGRIATTIAEDSWGNIWVGTFEGKTISKISGNTITQVTFNNGANRNFIFGILEDNKGNLWVGTVDNGLFHYDGAIMKAVEDGPTEKTITAMMKDSHGNLWIGTSEAGIALYITNPH